MSDQVFKNAFLIDGNGGAPMENAIVFVSDGEITDIAQANEGTITSVGRVIDLKGKSLLPGLIDAHVHIGNIEVDFDQTASLSPAVYVHRATRNLEKAVELGFTTLRDAGGLDWSFRDAIENNLINGPRLLLSVSFLTQTGGHADKRGVMRNTPLPRNSLRIFPMICDGPDEVRKAGREVLRKGADQIKVMASGGVASPSDEIDQWQYTIEELKSAVEVANAAGTYVMAHAYNTTAIKNCIEAGIHSIEHGNLLDSETAHMIAEKEIYYVPTLSVYDVLTKNIKQANINRFVQKKLEYVSEAALNALRMACEAGVKIGSGSDLIGPFQHHRGRELSLKAKVMTPMQAIVSATRTNAEMIGLLDKLGTIEKGKIADMIVVDGNPLEDLSLFDNNGESISLVMKDGQILKNSL